ncbi:MAG: hypothetical protein J0H14_18085 [Alphaproteobacteria bacterium]|nr:hypothetical protein [Alphaproteobacteria bacterium]
MTAAIFSVLMSKGACAQTAAEIQKYLAQQSKECSLYAYQENFRGMIPGMPQAITVASYTIESCNGGNNAFRTVGVFYEENGKVRQFMGPRHPISGPVSVTIHGDRLTVHSLEYGPNDARCCPTVRHIANYRLANGAITATR